MQAVWVKKFRRYLVSITKITKKGKEYSVTGKDGSINDNIARMEF